MINSTYIYFLHCEQYGILPVRRFHYLTYCFSSPDQNLYKEYKKYLSSKYYEK